MKLILYVFLAIYFLANLLSESYSQWNLIHSYEVPNWNSICSIDSVTLYAAGDKIIKSTDAGINWATVPSTINGPIRGIFFINTITGFVSIGGSILKTTDEGINWDTVISIPYGFTFTKITFTSNKKGFAIGFNGQYYSNPPLYCTTDGGETWTGRTSGFISISDVCFKDSLNGFILGGSELYSTKDGGSTWKFISEVNTNVYCISFYKDIGLALGYQHVWKTTNGGTNWFDIPTTGQAIGRVVLVDSNKAFSVYESQFLTITTDGGYTWNNCEPFASLTDILFLNKLTGIAVGSGGKILFTSDGGNNWINKGSNADYAFNKVKYLNTCAYILDSHSFGKSTDGGMTWSFQIIDYVNRLYGLSVIDSNNITIVGENWAIYRTTNGGNSWFKQDSSLTGPPTQISDVYYVTRDKGFITGHPCLKTTNSGDTWVQDTVSGFKISFIDSSNGMLCDWRNVYKTTNGGTSWIKTYSFGPYTMSPSMFKYASPGKIYLSGVLESPSYYGHIALKSTDGGYSWYELHFQGNHWVNTAAFLDSLNFTAITQIIGGFQIVKTTNGGNSWIYCPQTFSNNIYMRDISFSDRNNGLIVGDGFILKTTNGGITFVEGDKNIVPGTMFLSQNYPNPFNPATTIMYSVPSEGRVKLSVFNSLGQKVSELVNENVSAGSHEVKFNAAHLSSGVYFYKLESGSYTQVMKMLLLK